MNFMYFCIWIILCIAAGLGIGFLRGNLRLGITLIPLFIVPFSYVFCYDTLTILMLMLLAFLIGLNAKHIWQTWRKKQPRRKHPKLWISIPGTVLILIICTLFLISNAVISALLVPAFMTKLDAFNEVTEQSYSELVQTDDITENHKKAVKETNVWLQSVSYQKHSITTTDGYKLNGVAFFAEETSHNWVLLAHGYTGWKEEMYPYAYWYYTQGYNSLAPDCRSSGTSEGDYIGMGYTDSYDMLGWIDYILELDPQAKIILHGQSMGGATVLQMAGLDELPDCVVGVVSDCAYSDAFEMFENTGSKWIGMEHMPDWMLDFVCFTFRLRGGYNFYDASPQKSIQNSTLPILFIHGDMDRMIPVEMAKTLYDSYEGPKELLIMKGAGHAQSADKDPELYYSTIQNFLSSIN